MNNLIIIDDSICKEELMEFVNKYSKQIKLLLTEEDYNINLDNLVEKLQTDLSSQKLVFIATKNDILKLTLDHILFIQSSGENAIISLSNGEVHKLNHSFDYYQSSLKFNAILQVNEDTLVNINAITAYSFQEDTLLLRGNRRIIVEKSYKQQLIKAIKDLEN